MSVSGVNSNINQSLMDQINGTNSNTDREVSFSLKDGTTTVEKDGGLANESEEMGQDAFLNLLVTQLKYQDPLNPQGNEEFVAQLAQFSSLESSQSIEENIISMNTSLGNFVESQNAAGIAMTNASATSMIGKTALVEQDNFQYSKSNPGNINVHFENSGLHYLAITDETGEAVYFNEINKPIDSYDAVYEFPKVKNDGTEFGSGSYKVEIVSGVEGKKSGYAYTEDAISGVQYQDGVAQLIVGDETYNLSEIKEVK